MTTTIALDVGNGNTKIVASGRGIATLPNRTTFELAYSSQIKTITIEKYRQIEARRDVDMSDYFIVNGQAYVTGASANKSTSESFLKATGSQRYNQNVIGVAAAIAMRRVCTANIKPHVIASFPPAHSQYAEDLCVAIDNEWHVENEGVTRVIDVRDIFAIDEPVATYQNILLTKSGDRGRTKRAKDFANQVVMVVDGGHYTLDTAIIDRHAAIDYSNLRTFEDIAGGRTILDFSEQINTQYKRLLQGSRIDTWRYIEALQTGTFKAGIHGAIDVSQEAQEHRNVLFNKYLDAITVSSGGANVDEIVFTGGSSGLIRKELTEHFGNANVTFAGEGENIVLANAQGLHSFLKYALANGV